MGCYYRSNVTGTLFNRKSLSTAPNLSREVGLEKLSRVFQELVELGKEIASKGDIE